MFHFDGHPSSTAPALPKLIAALVELLHHRWFARLPCKPPAPGLSSYSSAKLGCLLNHTRQLAAFLVRTLRHRGQRAPDRTPPHLRRLAPRTLLRAPLLLTNQPLRLPHSHCNIGFLAPCAVDAQRSSSE